MGESWQVNTINFAIEKISHFQMRKLRVPCIKALRSEVVSGKKINHLAASCRGVNWTSLSRSKRRGINARPA
jgi:hypothetical protein